MDEQQLKTKLLKLQGRQRWLDLGGDPQAWEGLSPLILEGLELDREGELPESTFQQRIQALESAGIRKHIHHPQEQPPASLPAPQSADPWERVAAMRQQRGRA